LTTFGSSQDYGYSVVIRADGKIVVGGESNGYLAVARYNADGTLDTTFDGDGKATTLVGSSSYGRALAVQSDGSIVIAGYSYTGGNYDFAMARFSEDGTPDTTFDGDGKVVTAFSPAAADYAYGLALQPDGRLVAAGISGHDIALARYTAAGALDTSFDGDGMATTSFGEGRDRAQAVAIQADGKVVVAGYAYNGVRNDFAVARYHPDGSPDSSFDADGRLTTAFSSYTYTSDYAYAVAFQPDGKILVAGESGSAFALARYHPDGTLDTTFDGDGKVATPVGSSSYGRALAIQDDGKVVVAGYSYTGGNYDFAMARFNPNGVLDTTFDGDGKVITPIGTSYDYANCLAIQPDGKIVVAGYSYNGSQYDFALARYNPDGSLDAEFDDDGKLTTPIATDSYAYSVAIQPDGKIVVGGYAWSNYNTELALVRYNSSGSLDATFDGDGVFRTQVGTSTSYGYALAVQRDGKIVAAGSTWNGSTDFALVRVNAGGTLDTTFHGTGKVATPIGSGTDEARALAVQPDGRLVVAGFADKGGQDDFAVVRYQGDGPAAVGIADMAVDEDASDTAIEFRAVFADPTDDHASLTYTVSGNSNAALLTATPLGGPQATLLLHYAPDANGTSDITVRATDPAGWYVETIFAVIVRPVNDAPTLDLNGAEPGLDFSAGFAVGAGPARIIAPGATLDDVDSPTLARLAIAIIDQPDGADEILTADTGETSISASYLDGVLTLSGTDTLEHYQQVLRSVQYNNTRAMPTQTARTITFTATDDAELSSTPAVATVRFTIATVAGRHIFYNRSAFDGNDPAANDQDDNAIAPDKTALLPGGTGALTNYTSYLKGINGIMIDIAGLPGAVTAADFQFLVGNSIDLNLWTPAPAPASVTVRPGAGTGDSDRVTVIWADNTIKNKWLQVTVLGANTGLAENDVHYWGNQVGETGNNPANTRVDAGDASAVRAHYSGLSTVAVTSLYDINRDKRVDAGDFSAIRASYTGLGPSLIYLVAPPPAAMALTSVKVLDKDNNLPAASDLTVADHFEAESRLLARALAGTAASREEVQAVAMRDSLRGRLLPSAAHVEEDLLDLLARIQRRRRR